MNNLEKKLRNTSGTTTIFVEVDSMILRNAMFFCKERKLDFNKFVTQAIAKKESVMKITEAYEKTNISKHNKI